MGSVFEQNQSNSMKVTFAICAALGGCVGAVVGGAVVKAIFFTPRSVAAVDDVMAKAASEINRNLPMMIDQVTRLDATAALPGKKFTYRYTLLGVEELPEVSEFIKIVRPVMVNNYRTSTDMAEMRGWGVTLVYCYADEQGNEFARFEVSPQDIE